METENILEVKNINKKFGKKQVLKDVSFCVKPGEILGFIGPNGSGKTTTIKLIIGLQTIDKGTVIINGFDIKKEFTKAIEKVGTIVENPDLYMYLSGRKNLELIANLYDGVDQGRIDDIIDLIGLKPVINEKISKYSLGMRQRLGIGAALIQKPNLLILDEPTNGLDPEGIKELRDLLKKLVKEEKIGVLISSHNLAELDNFCTDVCIIKEGEVIALASMEEVKEVGKGSFIFTVNSTRGLKKVLDTEFKIIDNGKVRIFTDKKSINSILTKLIENNYNIYTIEKEEVSLEEAFLSKVGGK